MSTLHERIDALFMQIDGVRQGVHNEINYIRFQNPAQGSPLAQARSALLSADTVLNQVLDDLAEAACAAHKGGM